MKFFKGGKSKKDNDEVLVDENGQPIVKEKNGINWKKILLGIAGVAVAGVAGVGAFVAVGMAMNNDHDSDSLISFDNPDLVPTDSTATSEGNNDEPANDSSLTE